MTFYWKRTAVDLADHIPAQWSERALVSTESEVVVGATEAWND